MPAIRAAHTGRLVAIVFALAAIVLLLIGSPGRAVPANTPDTAPATKDAVRESPGVGGASTKYPEGAKIYATRCAACHETGAGRAPAKVVLSNLTPGMVVDALTSGAMQAIGASLKQEEKVDVAQYLTGMPLSASGPAQITDRCDAAHAKFDPADVPYSTGWGLTDTATHFVPAAKAGIDKMSVGKLKLKWAFGFPQSARLRSEPTFGAGAIFIGAHNGQVYALDRKTGCVRWTFDAGAEVRTAIVLEPWKAGDAKASPMLYFGDWKGNAYGLDAFTGKLVWKVHADANPAAVLTAAPVLYKGTLYVPVSSLEEASAATPGYKCCTFRGSILALDARTGKEKWRTWLVDEPKAIDDGNSLGPSGVPVWAGMALDTRRGHLLIATGDNYSNPATELSDAVVALDLATGKVVWHYQVLKGDAWNVDCVTPDPDQCPKDPGPDYDFGSGPLLAKGGDGKDYVLAANKSGDAYGIDPDTGKLIWQTKLGRGGMMGGTHFGIAAAGGRLFVPIGDQPEPDPAHPTGKPGLNALDVATGKLLWHDPAPMDCDGRQLCSPGYTGAISVTPDLVVAGSDDGFVRIYAADDGKLLWQYDTVRDYLTINGVKAKGGGMSGGAAPIIIDGELIVPSGYGFVRKLPGNALLVFAPE